MKISAVFLMLAAALPLAAADKLTLDECHKLARENYPAIKQFDLIKRAENFTLENANTKYYPQFSINANALYLSDYPTIMGQTPVPKDQYHTTLTATQVIWDGGNIEASKKITRAQAAIELQGNEVLMYSLNERVNRLFFGALLMTEAMRQNDILQADIGVAIRQIENRIAGGVANDFDLSLLKVELLKARQNKTAMESVRTSFIRMLSKFVGFEISNPDSLEVPKNIDVRAVVINRPELKYYDERSKLFDAKREAVNAALMPSIGLFGGAGYGRTNFDMASTDFGFYGLVGIQVSISFGDYYTEQNEKLKLVAQKKSVEAERETFLFNTELDLTEKDEEILKFDKLIGEDSEILQLRESIKKAALSRMSNGVITSRDYIKELNAYDLAAQDSIYHKLQKLSAQYTRKHITND